MRRVKVPPEAAARRRSEQVERYLELRPAVLAIVRAAVPEELRAELGSVTTHQLQALAGLPVEGLTMNQLAASLDVSGPAACALADRLVGRGLAERRADPRDRRVVRLVATESGCQMARLYGQAQRNAAVALLERLSEQQVDAMIEIMETLSSAVVPGGTAVLSGQAAGR